VSDARYWVSAEALDGILDRLATERTLIGPVRRGDDVYFRPVQHAADLCRDYVNALEPPKRWFLPTPERLARYRLPGGQPVDGGDEPRETVFFGIRSCDVAGLAQLTRFFSGETIGRPDVADGPFMARRERTTILSVVCQNPAETCMCVCCKGGPALDAGYDWQLTELSRGWLVEVGSAKGRALAERFATALVPADERQVAEREERIAGVVETFHRHSARRVQSMAAGRMVSQGRLPEAFWAELGERCVECGGCAFVCPTCNCFNVVDAPEAGAGTLPEPDGPEPAVPGGPTAPRAEGMFERLRLRDSCQLAGFVRQYGGSYPRDTCGKRCRTRFFHKLSWQFVARVGTLGCTGCGRCVQVCLGGIGIDVVSQRMTDVLVGAAPAAPAAKGA
jgi:formate hydrogenlyase subunit 6/NADH:ubiquinone oxidoreductase subunit I